MFFSIFVATAAIEEPAKLSFEVLKGLADGTLRPGLVRENFAPFVHALNAFATVGGMGSPRTRAVADAQCVYVLFSVR